MSLHVWWLQSHSENLLKWWQAASHLKDLLHPNNQLQSWCSLGIWSSHTPWSVQGIQLSTRLPSVTCNTLSTYKHSHCTIFHADCSYQTWILQCTAIEIWVQHQENKLYPVTIAAKENCCTRLRLHTWDIIIHCFASHDNFIFITVYAYTL